MKFDTKWASIEDFLVWYFYEGLRPSFKLWNDEKDQELDGWEKLIRKATRDKVKAKMQSTNSHDIDKHYYYGNRLMYASLEKVNKDSKTEKLKPKA